MIKLQKGMKISTVQNLFNTHFPFLKLEFFKHRHALYGGNPRKDLIKTDQIVLQPKVAVEEEKLVVNEHMAVSALEQLFKDYFGLSAQVFRKSGRSWLETTVTDDWSLKKQNEQGEELSLM